MILGGGPEAKSNHGRATGILGANDSCWLLLQIKRMILRARMRIRGRLIVCLLTLVMNAVIFPVIRDVYFIIVSKNMMPTTSARKCAIQEANTLLDRAKIMP